MAAVAHRHLSAVRAAMPDAAVLAVHDLAVLEGQRAEIEYAGADGARARRGRVRDGDAADRDHAADVDEQAPVEAIGIDDRLTGACALNTERDVDRRVYAGTRIGARRYA